MTAEQRLNDLQTEIRRRSGIAPGWILFWCAVLLFCAGFGVGVFYRAETRTRWQIVTIDGDKALLDRQNGDTYEVSRPLFTREEQKRLDAQTSAPAK